MYAHTGSADYGYIFVYGFLTVFTFAGYGVIGGYGSSIGLGTVRCSKGKSQIAVPTAVRRSIAAVGIQIEDADTVIHKCEEVSGHRGLNAYPILCLFIITKDYFSTRKSSYFKEYLLIHVVTQGKTITVKLYPCGAAIQRVGIARHSLVIRG